MQKIEGTVGHNNIEKLGESKTEKSEYDGKVYSSEEGIEKDTANLKQGHGQKMSKRDHLHNAKV